MHGIGGRADGAPGGLDFLTAHRPSTWVLDRGKGVPIASKGQGLGN